MRLELSASNSKQSKENSNRALNSSYLKLKKFTKTENSNETTDQVLIENLSYRIDNSGFLTI